jgi:hypothetical protein
MLSAELGRQILEVHAHNEQWSFVNKPAQIRFHSKRPHTITNMKDNINLDSAIAESTNGRS